MYIIYRKKNGFNAALRANLPRQNRFTLLHFFNKMYKKRPGAWRRWYGTLQCLKFCNIFRGKSKLSCAVTADIAYNLSISRAAKHKRRIRKICFYKLVTKSNCAFRQNCKYININYCATFLNSLHNVVKHGTHDLKGLCKPIYEELKNNWYRGHVKWNFRKQRDSNTSKQEFLRLSTREKRSF